MDKNTKIFIAGHNGMVGSAIKRNFEKAGFRNIIDRDRKKLDLLRQEDVEKFFKAEAPDVVIVAAAKVGGILANDTYRAQFIYENLVIQSNIINTAHISKVKKLLFLGSSCIYPKLAPQPLKEEYLLTGKLEKTNEPYAIAKIAGIKMCENYYHQYGDNYISIMPTNLYGPNDNFDSKYSHVLPALIRKFHEAKISNQKKVTIWGTGNVYREFMHVNDMADACKKILSTVNASDIYNEGITHINIGTGEDLSIKNLADKIASVIKFRGHIDFDPSKPDGVPRKLLDVSRLHSLGWKHEIKLDDGIKQTYKWFIDNQSS